MASLLYKEFLTQRTVILVYLAAAVLFITQTIQVDGPIALVTLFAMFNAANSALQEDKNNSHILINSLPTLRKEVVTAKYLFPILFGGFLVGITWVYQAAFGPSLPENGLLQTAFAIAVIIWFVSIFFPMYYWLGPRFVQIGMIVFFILMFAVLPMVYHVGMKHNFWGIPGFILSLPAYSLVALLSGVTVIVLLGSWRLSVWLYERKDL